MKHLLVLCVTTTVLFSCAGEKEQPAAPADTEKTFSDEVREQTVRNPNDAEAWYHLSDLYERSGMYREEVNALQKVIALDPKRGYAYLKLGNAYNRLAQYQDAIKSYTIAIRSFPQNPVLRNNLAISYGKVGKTDEEIASLEKAISLRPRYSTARYNLGMALLKKGRRQEALNQYRELDKFDAGIANALKIEIERKGK